MAIRDDEIHVLRKAAYLNAFSTFTWSVAPFMVSDLPCDHSVLRDLPCGHSVVLCDLLCGYSVV